MNPNNQKTYRRFLGTIFSGGSKPALVAGRQRVANKQIAQNRKISKKISFFLGGPPVFPPNQAVSWRRNLQVAVVVMDKKLSYRKGMQRTQKKSRSFNWHFVCCLLWFTRFPLTCKGSLQHDSRNGRRFQQGEAISSDGGNPLARQQSHRAQAGIHSSCRRHHRMAKTPGSTRPSRFHFPSTTLSPIR